MVTLYVGGKPIGSIADAGRLLPDLIARRETVEFRNDAGEPVSQLTPVESVTPLPPGEPPIPWEPDVTWEEIERRVQEPGYTYEEVKKRLGWE